jgi:hypothetical protein
MLRERLDRAPGSGDPRDRLERLWGVTPSYDYNDYT